MSKTPPTIQIARLSRRLQELAAIGALEGGGVSRLALTEEEGRGRDLVTAWMRGLGLHVTVDHIGNVIAVRPAKDGSLERPVLMGSHIDTVATGGPYDGNLGVLGGLEVIETLNDHGIETQAPVAVGFFTNEEGARFAPDMLGSGVHQGALDLDVCLETVSIDGARLADELERTGYAGDTPCGSFRARAYFELHVEQGPVLEEEGLAIGAVTGVQGISWTEWRFRGVSNHAGTTPMRLRHDAGLVASEVVCFVRRLATELGEPQVATVGAMTLLPNLVNVIANDVTMTVDLRNTDDAILKEAEARTAAFIAELAEREGVTFSSRKLARFAPVAFDPAQVDLVESTAKSLGHGVKRMPSGAGHDAQMFAPNCPTAMIFVPSAGGISHNIEEFTSEADIEAGANVLLRVVLAASRIEPS
jgi:N-carbamoyl-L-amino-acid hydrolase